MIALDLIKNISIKNKIVVIILIIAIFIMVSGFLVIGTWEFRKQKSNIISDLIINAKLISDNCIIPLSFSDNERALEVISNLNSISSFEQVSLFDSSGSLFVSFPETDRTNLSLFQTDSVSFFYSESSIIVSHPIYYHGINYGTLILTTNTSTLHQYIYNYFKLAFLILIFLIIITFILANRMQRLISAPILLLKNNMKAITQSHDFSMELKKINNDEIGDLYDSFNDLIGEIGQRSHERDLAESSLISSKQKLDLALIGGGIGIWDWDLKTDVTIWDERMEIMFGLKKGTFGQDYKSFKSCLHPDDILKTEKALQKAIERNIPFDIVYRSLWKSGEIRYISAKAIVTNDVVGKPIKMTGVCIDLSDLKKAETKLKISEKKFRDLFENLNEGFAYHEIITDNDGDAIDYTFLDINKTFTKLTGFKSSDVIGKRVTEVFPGIENASPNWISRYGQVAKTGTEIIFEDYLEPLQKWFLVHAFSPENGKFATAFSDITESKRSEQDILKLNEELEYKVLERTKELENTNRELEAFSYSVSHDLIAPLRAINGFSKFLEEDFEPILGSEGKRLVQVIRNNVLNMDQLITDLLQLSRVSRNELSYTNVDMESLAHAVFEQIALPGEKDHFSFEVSHLPNAYVDPTSIKQVWSNLISNALKYSSATDTKRIVIDFQQNKNNIVYFVKDSGVGFNPDYKHKLFGIFQRLHTVDEFEGTGVGLAIVQRIIHKHRGEVWAEGEVDNGATFYFSIPRKKK